MKLKVILFSWLSVFLLSLSLTAQDTYWNPIREADIPSNGVRQIVPLKSQHFSLNINKAKKILDAAPLRFSDEAADKEVIFEFPTPDGKLQRFSIVNAPVFAPELAAKYPEIQSYAGRGIDDPHASVRFDIGPKGFHAMILSPNHSSIFIDPYHDNTLEHYSVYYKKDFSAPHKVMTCDYESVNGHLLKDEPEDLSKAPLNGDCQFRTYRMALACTGEYASFHGGTVPLVLAAMNTSMTRVNGIYEREFSVTMVLVPNNDQLIFLNAGSDPYSNNNGSAMLSQNITTCNNIIGSANYDIGHVFSTGGGGIAYLQSVCGSNKAGGVTGQNTPVGDPFDVDYVCHEVGHQFGGRHTQNNSCNRDSNSCYEPGSASTIMGYAGICSPNVQSNSDDYFHVNSLIIMNNFIVGGGNCAVITNTGNNAPVAAAGPDHVIPRSTPFVLEGSATDADNDPLTYCWEQYDKQIATMPPQASNTSGPAFRSLDPSTSPDRYMPSLTNVVNNTNNTWEVLSNVTRSYRFRLTARDNHVNGGCTHDDLMNVDVTASSGPFLVITPNTNVSWPGNSSQTVTWDVANTTASPVNCSGVDIFLSYDGGFTYPVTLATNVTNDGSHTVTLPGTQSTTARIMVKGHNNIFYDISNQNFTISAPVGGFILGASPNTQTICGGSTGNYTINTSAVGGFNNPVSLSISGLPGALNANFSPNPVIPGSNSNLTISNTNAVPAGTYNFIVTGTSGAFSFDLGLTLVIESGILPPGIPSIPTNGATGLDLQPTLTWNVITGADTYEIQVADSPTFSNIIESQSGITGTSYDLTTVLNPFTQYFWRVRGSNNCVTGSYGAVFNFTTGNTICSNIISTDIPISISSGGPNTITSDIIAGSTGTIADINIVDLDLSHTYINDLLISISSPNGTSVTLVDQICGNQNNMFIGFDDESPNNHNSIPCPPLDGSSYQPDGNLSDFIGENGDGTWVLTVEDLANQDGGSLNAWSIDICYEQLVPLAATIQGTDVDCFGESTGTAFVIPSGGTGAYTYQWSNGDTGSATTNLSAGSYTCTISDGNSSITLSVQIGQPSNISVSATVDPVSSGNDGAIDLSVNGGTQPYSYSWSTGATTQDITGLDAGVYAVTITDGNDCINIEAYEVLLPPAPVVVISADVVQGCSPLTVQFTDLSSNNPTAWAWTFNGGTPATSTEQNPVVTFDSPGLYTVSLTAENPGGAGNSTLIDFIEVLPDAVPSFTSSINGLDVSFTNQSTNADSYSWDFGDGQGSTATNPNHTYQNSGQFTVTLTVTNSCGQFTVTQNIDILIAPTANFEVIPNQGCEPLTVQFVSTSAGQVDNYLWTFEGGTPATSTEANPVVIFTQAGLYDVSLEVSNSAGTDELILSDIIEVFSLATANYSFTENGLDVDFTNLSQNATSYSWDFGDGQGSSETNPSHTYQSSGTYTVVLTASNDCGDFTFSQEISVLIAPTAAFDFDPAQGCEPLTVQFNSTSTGTISNYLWTFEGGTPATSTEANPVVTFDNAGIFDVSLNVSNAAGADELILQDIIEVLPNPVSEFDQTINGMEVSFTNLSQNATSYNWNFGDGNSSTEENPVHSYQTSGTYTVILIASNACGDFTFTSEISILVPPVANFSFDPSQGCTPLTVQFTSNATGTVDNYLWTFEGGTPSTSSEANPVVVFENAGLFDVSLNVSNASGADELILQDIIEVLPIPQPSFDFVSNGLDVVFSNQTQNASTYAWDFGDGNGSNEINPEHSYAESGTYTVILTASNACGDFTFSQEITVLIAPTAAFEYDPAQGCAALTVQFNSTSLGLVEEYLWTFEGGTPATSTEANPVVVFNTPGLFDVSLEVSNAAGADLLELTEIIEVFSLPTPQFEISQNGLEVQLTNLTINATEYEWDFGDSNTSNEVNPTHTYADGGNYTISLTASNDCGDFTITQQISVLLAPTAVFGSEQTNGCSPFTVQFEDQSIGQVDSYLWTFEGGNPSTSTQANPVVVYQTAGTFDVSLVVTNAQGENELVQEDFITVETLPNSNFSYAITGNTVTFTNTTDNANDFIWEFGDGNSSNELDPVHTYLAPGFYTVSLTAFNDCGQSSFVVDINVGLEFPLAAFDASAISYCAPSTVTFTDMSTGSPDSWFWTFEGGTPETSTQQNPTITFSEPGNYDISLEVSNSIGSNTILAEDFIEISTTPTVAFTSEMTGGNTFLFTNASLNADEYLWDFGDGNTSTVISPNHVYSETGTYTVSLTAFNECGESILSEVIVITSSSNTAIHSGDVLLIPNPNQGSFMVDWSKITNLDVRQISVINTLGQLMYLSNENAGKSHAIEMNDVAAGVYYLIIETPEQQIIRKVVIQ